jgi:AcrR family transcriptional regulator
MRASSRPDIERITTAVNIGSIGSVSDPVKRKYDAPARAAAAAATRARIRAAAMRLFVERGYAATTMSEVAREAGVGQRTLYDAFPNKLALFSHTLDVARVGDETPVAVADRPAWHEVLDEPHPVRATERLVAFTGDLFERAGDLIMVSIQAADADADLRKAEQTGAEATYSAFLAFAEHLDELGALKTGLDPASAADIVLALGSPHVHHLLRRRRRWGVERYRTWLVDSIADQLLDDRWLNDPPALRRAGAGS